LVQITERNHYKFKKTGLQICRFTASDWDNKNKDPNKNPNFAKARRKSSKQGKTKNAIPTLYTDMQIH
jgi:hypothetical protein